MLLIPPAQTSALGLIGCEEEPSVFLRKKTLQCNLSHRLLIELSMESSSNENESGQKWAFVMDRQTCISS
jgi:hypothetical protein